MLLEKIEAIKAQINELKAQNEEELEALRIKYLSKKGEITALFNDFRTVAPEQKREFGQRLNELKNLASEKISALKADYRHLFTPWFHTCRRPRNRGRLARVLVA